MTRNLAGLARLAICVLAIYLASAGTVGATPHTGWASYYADWKKPQGSFYAAMPGYRWGHPFYVTVWYGKRHLRVLVQDACQCHVGRPDAKIIDLSWHAFTYLTRLPLSRGTARVTVVR